ncbi:MAG: hypothetical protein ACFFD4_19595 [Candidatus Odinarchaeota archaeon]
MNPENIHPASREIVLLGLGEGAVGKTTLVYTAAFNRSVPNAGFTCGLNNINFPITLDGVTYSILVQEFGGQEQFGPWLIKTTPAITNADAVLLFFDLSFIETLFNLQDYIKQINCRKPGLKAVLVGTKADLEWNVTPGEITAFMKDNDIEQVAITSSLKNYNCLEPFKLAVAVVAGLDYQAIPVELCHSNLAVQRIH